MKTTLSKISYIICIQKFKDVPIVFNISVFHFHFARQLKLHFCNHFGCFAIFLVNSDLLDNIFDVA